MRTRVDAAVIGGGVTGVSVLYHLARMGLDNCMLIERAELTAGSTWHAAGVVHTINSDPNIATLQSYTLALYDEIEALSGVSCGMRRPGGIYLASTPERLDYLRLERAKARYMGMDADFISMDEVRRLNPLVNTDEYLGALFEPADGSVDPSGVTNAYARSAIHHGAEVVRNNPVHDLTQRPDGSWDVHTEHGVINCEHFVNAGGLWAREVGRMCGIELPVQAMEHMYFLTEEIDGIDEWLTESGGHGRGVLDFGGEIYLRAEGRSLLLGTYEQACVPWQTRSTPWDFGSQLLTPDLERLTPSLEVGFAHFPIYAEVGIKQVVNGPFTFAPDGNPLIGPVRGQRGHWVACGVMAGLSQGGGVGLAMANWMTTGDPGFDVWGMDVARFGDWTTPAYTVTKVQENYRRRFQIPFPNEELPDARPLHTTPIHGRLTEANAVWGAAYGLEYALWFQRPDKEPFEEVTFHRSNAFPVVAEEVAAVREGVGMIETTGFAKHEFAGPGARAALDRLMTNRIPTTGRLALTPMLNEAGRLIGDFTVAALADQHTGSEKFMVFGSGVAEGYHQRWFLNHLQGDDTVAYRPLGNELTGLSIAGPAARDLLAAIAEADVDAEAFRFLDIRPMALGMVPALVGRITFTGDLGYEIWVPASLQARLFDLISEVGADHGLRLFGLRALDSMRFDKNFGAWATEYRPIYDPFEAGMDRFVKLDKGDFVGRDAASDIAAAGPERHLCAFTIDADGSDVAGDEPIWHDGEVVGWATSGGYAHHSQASCALGYLPASIAASDTGFQIEVVGTRREATRLDEPLFDPTGSRMRG